MSHARAMEASNVVHAPMYVPNDDPLGRSSASSSSSDLTDQGVPIMPYHDSPMVVAHASFGKQVPTLRLDKMQADPMSSYSSTSSMSAAGAHPVVLAQQLHAQNFHLPQQLSESFTSRPAKTSRSNGRALMQLQSPTAQSGSFTFEEVISPRNAMNGKRYLGGYLQHRVSMAGGFLKTWKRKYFRLRDHGILCFKQNDDSRPLFEIHFKAQSVLVVDKPAGRAQRDAADEDDEEYMDPATMKAKTSRGKVNGSMMFTLKHVEVQGHQTPANKVEIPLFLKAESETELHTWVENIRLKMEARRRALAQSSVNTVMPDQPTNSGNASPNRSRTSGTPTSLGSPTASSPPVSPPTLERPQSLQDVTAARKSEKPRLVFTAGGPDPPEFAMFRAKYALMKEIGEGSFSIVHRAASRLTGQLCAVKCCKHSNALEEEVGILRRLSHPNIIGLEGVYCQDDMFYVVMDYMQDGDLCERLIQKQRFTEPEAKVIIIQVLRALEYLHRNNVLHRDIKPENILLHGAMVKIADFGLAKQLPNATSMLKRSCGTLEYAAPELLCGKPYGLKSDIFSLGVVLYVLLFGAFPFSIESAAALQRMERFPDGVDVRDMSCLHPDNAQWKKVSPAAQDVLLRMLCVNEKERFTARELLVHPWFDMTPSPSDSAVPRRDSALETEEQESRRLEDCRVKGFTELLPRGLELIKYGKDGQTAPHETTLTIDFVHGTISWTARSGILGLGGSKKSIDANTPSKPSKSRVIAFSDIQEIRVGHATAAFRSINGKETPSAELCLSIISSWRTLDLVVKAPSQREFMLKGLYQALDQFRQKRKQQPPV
ncbi:hypothetical protein Poli38472_008209 [Pythium oligandrum]|uniref:Uncharacterized protein n=1 Tax=Pythium oligandrum TaxID=41045 RepID=A0A8K1FN70_PYTOL|nr:hypothetical protein Poli38472_008209 [Pythium oligandrum]|eukprot:TMW65567.1 hypothetical protein Poli38472_008209 [Pythium oligandrum]